MSATQPPDPGAELAQALARLLITRYPAYTLPADLQLLAPYREDVLNSLAALHRRLTPAKSAAEQPEAAAGALGAALAGHPRGAVSELAPTERAERPLGGTVGHAWRSAAVQALLLADTPAAARHLFATDTPRGAMSAMADLAAAVEAFAVAESDLRALATRSRLAHLLPDADPEQLRGVASSVARSLRAELRHLPAPPQPADTPPAIRIVSAPGDLPGAQLQVAALLTAPPPPPLLAQIAVGQARAALAAAALLRTACEADQARAPTLQPAADALTRRAGHLSSIGSACIRVHGPRTSAGTRAAQQTGELLRHLQQAAATLAPADAAAGAPALLDFARAGRHVVAGMHRIVQQAFDTGAYLVPNPTGAAQPVWVPAGRLGPPPPLLAVTDRAVTRETGLAAAFPAGTAGQPAHPDPNATRWQQICADLDPRVVDDPHWPALAAALTRAEHAGTDVAAVLRDLTENQALPADHPARSLHYRLLDSCEAALTPPPAAAKPPPAAVCAATAIPAISAQPAPAPRR